MGLKRGHPARGDRLLDVAQVAPGHDGGGVPEHLQDVPHLGSVAQGVLGEALAEYESCQVCKSGVWLSSSGLWACATTRPALSACPRASGG